MEKETGTRIETQVVEDIDRDPREDTDADKDRV